MKFTAALDVDVVAHETGDEVVVMLDLTAPPVARATARRPSTLQVVLDRSGSMSGAPLEGAKEALVALVQRLEPTDNFGLVVFDTSADIVVPSGPLEDKTRVVQQIRAVRTGGQTDLSAGYVRGLRELRRVAGDQGGTVLVISDGHVNAGVRDPEELAALGARAGAGRVVTSTLGYGHHYDESMLAALARSGSGNHVFAADPDAAGAAIAAEVDGLLDKAVLGASVTVRLEPTVQMLRLYNDLPVHEVGDGAVMIELGDLYADEERRLLLELRVPALPALGLAQVATLHVEYVELPALVAHTLTLPISVNVVPGDEASRRVPDPSVRSEQLFQQAQAVKLTASVAFEKGDVDQARRLLGDTARLFGEAERVAPSAAKESIARERAAVEDMGALTDQESRMHASRLSKETRSSFHRENRKRGRRPEGDASGPEGT